MALADIQTRITAAEAAAGRPTGSTRLIAVSKVQPDARVEAVLQQGQRLYGENRVQEAAGKWPEFRDRFEGISVQLIGPLQSNKARQAMELFEAMHWRKNWATVQIYLCRLTLAKSRKKRAYCRRMRTGLSTAVESWSCRCGG